MKKIYEMPVLELKSFDAQDIIAASSAIVDEATFKANARVNNQEVTAVAEWNTEWNSFYGI